MGRVAFSGVSFAYPTRSDVQVLQDFSLTVEPNQTVALVGTSGSGALTVLFWCSASGRFLCGGCAE
jgi:ABC-type multidrug transport system fused ATPase/permease subunit